MSRWTDLAAWRGPTDNKGGAMKEHRGLVIHIAVGYFEGTIAWQRNPDANVSSHFVVGRDGRMGQVVDTDAEAWTQSAGNGHWLSSENEGFLLGDRRNPGDWHLLTPQMIEANAQLFARMHRQYGVPLQLATSPTGRGLGYHSMGAENGYNWGHSSCPGEPIKAQLPQVLARAIEIVGGAEMDWNDKLTIVDDGKTLSFPADWLMGTNASVPAGRLYRQEALAASDATRDAAVLTAVQALANAGGVDAAPIVEAIQAEAAATRALVEQRHQEEMTALRAERDAEVAALRAELDVLTAS